MRKEIKYNIKSLDAAKATVSDRMHSDNLKFIDFPEYTLIYSNNDENLFESISVLETTPSDNVEIDDEKTTLKLLGKDLDSYFSINLKKNLKTGSYYAFSCDCSYDSELDSNKEWCLSFGIYGQEEQQQISITGKKNKTIFKAFKDEKSMFLDDSYLYSIFKNTNTGALNSLRKYKFILSNFSIKEVINSNDSIYLEEFPEYLAGYIPFATNTGLMCFYNGAKSTLIIYDLVEEEEDISLNSINPDISFFADYNYIATPLNIRKINYKNNQFIADKTYKYNSNNYSFFNCDKIGDLEADNKGFFRADSIVSNVSYEFKPVINIRAFTNNGEKNTKLKIKINNEDMKQKDNSNIYYYDCSNFIENKTVYLLKLLSEDQPSVNQPNLIINGKVSVVNNTLKVQPKNIETVLINNFPNLVLTLTDNKSSGYLEVT